MAANIDQLINEYLLETWERSPVQASMLGVDGYDHLLDDCSEQSFLERYERADHWLSQFRQIPDEGLELDQVIDRDLIISHLNGLKILEDWQNHKREPATYLSPGLYGVFTLFLNRIHDEEELTRAAVARMEGVQEVLEHGKKNLDPKMVPKLFAERALGMCRAAVGYFRDLVPAEAKGERNRQALVEAGEPAARAYEDFATFLEKLSADAQGDWAIGEERYSALLIEKEQLGYDSGEMLERGRQAFDELTREMAAHTRQWKGTDDWLEVRKELQEKSPFDTPDQVRDEFEKWTNLARQFLIERDLVTLPDGEQCFVVPSPPFQRPILAVASYSAPPAFKPTRVGHFFVPYPPDGTPEEEIRKRARGNGAFGIPSTAVHEAYPGHHWHLVKMKDNPRPIRKVIRTSYFTEGWALYAELMMREQGFFTDPAHELGQIGARLFRAARIIVDVSLHTGRMTHDEAVDFLLKNFGGSEPTIKTEVGRYCSWPTQAPSYLTGSLEIERIRKRYLSADDSLKGFHDEIATSGGLPIGLAERALLG